MGLSDWLRKLKMAGTKSRPRRDATGKLRVQVSELRARLEETERERDTARAEARVALAEVAELEQERHGQDVQCQKLQDRIDGMKIQIDGMGLTIAYHEERWKTLAAIEAMKAARATQPGGGYDVQSVLDRR